MKTFCSLSLLIICLLICSFQASAAVKGIALLEGQTDNSGINVHFLPFSKTAVEDSTQTLTDGSLSINLKGGIYEILYSKLGYEDKYYNDTAKVALAADDTLNSITLLSTNNSIILQDTIQGGFWTKDKQYLVMNNITLPKGDTIIIMPGTLVKFNYNVGNITFNVYGVLIVDGTEKEPITFTSSNSNPNKGDWFGIYLYGTSSIFNYCNIDYCNACITTQSDSVSITNTKIHDYSSYGILGYSNGYINIRNCEIYNFTDEGIYLDNDHLYSEIDCNYIHDGGDGILGKANSIIRNNFVARINSIGITGNYVENNYVIGCVNGIHWSNNVINNTVVNNPCGIFACTNVFNNIIANNSYGLVQVLIEADTSSGASYNLIWNNGTDLQTNIIGLGKVVTTNNKGYGVDSYMNMYQDPKFFNGYPPLLLPNSPCYGTGDSIYSANIGFYDSLTCLNIPTGVPYNPIPVKEDISLYPNPSSDFIEINIPVEAQRVVPLQNMGIYNVLGELVLNLTPTLSTGEGVKVDVSGLATGVYFVKVGEKIFKFVKV